MATFDEKQAQAVIKRLQHLCSEADDEGDAARGVLRAIDPTVRQLREKLGVGADGKLPADTWSQLQEQEKIDAQLQLSGMVDALEAAVAGIDEPRDPASFMYRVHASNAWIYVLVIGSVVVVAVVIWGIYRYWNVATSAKAVEGDVLRTVIPMGALGGAIHWMSLLANYIGNGNLFRRWIPYYVLAPFQGAALAMVVYLLLRVGVLAPPANAMQNGGPAQSLNLLGLYAFAGSDRPVCQASDRDASRRDWGDFQENRGKGRERHEQAASAGCSQALGHARGRREWVHQIIADSSASRIARQARIRRVVADRWRWSLTGC